MFIRVSLHPFLRDFAVKLIFVVSGLVIVYTIKVWYQFHPHSSNQAALPNG